MQNLGILGLKSMGTGELLDDGLDGHFESSKVPSLLSFWLILYMLTIHLEIWDRVLTFAKEGNDEFINFILCVGVL